MKILSTCLHYFHSLPLLAALVLLGAQDARSQTDQCGNTNPSGDPPPPDGCESDETGNSTNTPQGPMMKIPRSTGAAFPKTGQSFLHPFGSNGRSSAVDLEIHGKVGELPLEFRRFYQSRAVTGGGDIFGHGLTWSHSFSWRMFSSGGTVRTIVFPDGRSLDFTAHGSATLDGVSHGLHVPVVGRGERVYSGKGADEAWFTLVMPDGKRHAFERELLPEGGALYHPRYSRDDAGRELTYTTDAAARIVRVEDAAGNFLSLQHGAVQINRKVAVLLHQVTTDPLAGWNEVTFTTAKPYRWFQALSAERSYFNLAEIEVYGPDGAGGEARLAGSDYGTGPANYYSPTETFDKALDGDLTTGYRHSRPAGGIAGIDLGAGNESHALRIRFHPRITGPGWADMHRHKGLRFEALEEAPEIIEVLQRVESSDGRAVNYVYDTVEDTSIGQTHLVLAGVDYDGDGLAQADTDARFTYVITNEGRGPSVETFREPRGTGDVPYLKFEYRSGQTATRGTVGAVRDASTGELIVENTPDSTRKLTFPGQRETQIRYSSSTGLYDLITDADGNHTSFTYDASKFLTSQTDAMGRTTYYTHNFRGQRLTVTRPDGMVQTGTYDDAGRLIGVTDTAAGYPTRTTTWTRDASGKVVRKDYPDGSYETYAYNALGLVTQKRERNGSITTRAYDATGLCLSHTLATGTAGEETTTHTYYGTNDPTGSPARLLKTETDQRGRVTSYEYNNRGQVTRTTYPDGSFRQFTYDAFGSRTAESDGVHSRSWTYNGFKKMTSETDPMGHLTQYFYGDGGIACTCYNGGGPTLVISAEGRRTLREYDNLWRLKKETVGHNTPEAATTEFVYDFTGNLIQKVLPGNVFHNYGHDFRDRMTSHNIQGPDGHGGTLNLTTGWTYDPFGNRISETKPGNRVTTMTYNVMDKALNVTDALGTVTTFTYDLADNRLTTTQDAGGPLQRVTGQTYDLLNRPLTTTYPDNTSISQTYHPGGAVHTRTDELGRTTTYDDSLVTWQDSKGNTWSSFVATVTDALNHTSASHPIPTGRFAGTSMSVTPMGRAVEGYRNADGTTAETRTGLTTAGSTVPQDLSVTVFNYDDDHLLLSQTTNPGGLNLTTSHTYDARSNRITTTDPLSRTTGTQYDLRGNHVKTVLPDNREHHYGYDALNRKTSDTNPKNETIAHTWWNETSIMVTLKDARNNSTTWTHNALGQILTKGYPNGDTHTYTYDSLHRMLTHRTPMNETCAYSYDLRDRQILADWSSTTPDTAKTYWANGLLKSIDNGVSKSDYAYSLRNELTSETQTLAGQAPKVVTYGYDADGLRGGMVHPSARIVELAWTARAQLQAVTADGPPPFATYGYDKAGRVTGIAHENGVTEVKSYNAASELLSNVHQFGGTMVGSHAYGYDPTGRRISEQGGTTLSPVDKTFGYDTADQVTSATYGSTLADAYNYDAMGNRTTATVASLGGAPITYTANNANQYTSISGMSAPSHDANGNLVQQNNVTYDWDSENRLLAVTPNTPALGERSLVHNYDGQHRRVTRTIREWTTTGWADVETIHFIYDGWNVIEEYALAGGGPVLRRTFTWGADLSGSLQGAGGVGGLLMTEEISGTTTTAYHFHYDGNGNVTEITDNTGSSAASYRYDAFGNTLVATGTYAAQNRYRFSTKPLDPEVPNVPLYYYGYRYYDPATGRWPSRDPIGERGGVNLYGFVGNNVIKWVDVLGLDAGAAVWGGAVTGARTGGRTGPVSAAAGALGGIIVVEVGLLVDAIDDLNEDLDELEQARERERCTATCQRIYDQNSEKCRCGTPEERAKCWAQLAEDLADCIRDCN